MDIKAIIGAIRLHIDAEIRLVLYDMIKDLSFYELQQLSLLSDTELISCIKVRVGDF